MPPKPPHRRRTQEERSTKTRQRLIRATIDLLIERGYARLTTADIAKRACVSSGARVHHFRTKEDLVVAANEHVYGEALALGTRRAQEASDPLEAFIRDQSVVYFGVPFLPALEGVVAGRSDPKLAARMRPVMERYRTTINNVWLHEFVAAGYREAEAEVIIRLTVHIMRGIGLSSVWNRDDAANKDLLRRFKQMVDALFADGALRNKLIEGAAESLGLLPFPQRAGRP